jgi:hypothetical protein
VAIVSTLSITVNLTGSDANGNTINQTVVVPPVANASETLPLQTPFLVSPGANTFTTNASTYGYKMVTITPPTPNSANLYLGASTAGQQVASNLPMCFGITSISTIGLFYGGSGAAFSVQLTLS